MYVFVLPLSPITRQRSSLTRATVFQTIGGAFSISAGQAAFLNRLLIALPKLAPKANPAQVLKAGAFELQNVFPPELLPGVLQAYMVGIKAAFAVAVAFCGMALLCTLAMPLQKLPGTGGETAAKAKDGPGL